MAHEQFGQRIQGSIFRQFPRPPALAHGADFHNGIVDIVKAGLGLGILFLRLHGLPNPLAHQPHPRPVRITAQGCHIVKAPFIRRPVKMDGLFQNRLAGLERKLRHHIFLAFEIMIESSFGYAAVPCNIFHGDPVKSSFPDQLSC